MDSIDRNLKFISHTHAKCYFAFEQLLDAIRHPVRDFGQQIPLKDVQEEFNKYKIFAGNVGAAHSGKLYEISLDYRLREATFLKNQVLSLLGTLEKRITDATALIQGLRKPFEEQVEVSNEDSLSLSSLSDAGDEEVAAEDSPWEISSNSSRQSNVSQTTKQDQNLIGHSSTTQISEHATKPHLPSDPVTSLGMTPSREMPRILNSIQFTVSCLYRLPIRKPAPLDRIKDKTSLESAFYQHFDILYVKDKFPQLDAQVATRLGMMITRRRQILLYRNSHAKRLHTSHVEPNRALQTIVTSNLLPTIDDSITPQNIQPDGQVALSQASSSEQTLRSKATTLRFDETALAAILEDKADSLALYAPSVAESKSSMASSYSGGDLQVEVPPRPTGEDGEDLEWFECPYCLIIKNITTDHRWK
jgi:hypothetical protein